MPVGIYPRKSIQERFWAKVRKGEKNECWIWLGGCLSLAGRLPYGKFWINGRLAPAHRVSWELTNGTIPDGLLVLHDCPGGDNPKCVNPVHLFLGTHLDNMKDKVKKGRQAKGDSHYSRTRPELLARGQKHGMTKLSLEQIKEIPELLMAGMCQTEIAKQLNVSPFCISYHLKKES